VPSALATKDVILSILVIVLGATGTYLLLPHRHGLIKPRSVHLVGGGLAGLSVLLLALFWTPPGPFLTSLFFYAFGIAAVAGGILTITTRNPIYSALWFASVVLATSGLFLLSGAQFLAAGTVIVYAGAIIVTFLFVIMLAQSQGQAMYDRTARSPGRATFSCFVLLWSLIYAILSVQAGDRPRNSSDNPKARRLVRASQIEEFYRLAAGSERAVVLDQAYRKTSKLPMESSTAAPSPPHVAGLGGSLYTDHLISAEIAGVLLFVALVGALAIATPKPPVRPGDRPPVS
jgi:NADH-quinone oxidoreductase subunit J